MAKIIKEKDLTKERDERLIPLAQKIVELITEAKLPIGDVHAHDNAKFTNVARNILSIMLDANTKYVEKEYLFQLVFQQFDNIAQIVKKSLDESFNSAENKLFGKQYRELTLSDLDEVLKRDLSAN